MSFALPTAFWLGALGVPIVALYILKIRLRRVPVSTNIFWKQIFDEKPPRSIWQHLRHLLSLLAQLLLAALLILAVADPYLPWQLVQAQRVVLVIDNSASMQAADVSPSRFAAAREAAARTVDELRFRDEMAVVTAGANPAVVIGMSGHAPTLKRAIRGIEPSDNPTELAPAIALGRKLISNHPRGRIVIFTDGCADDIAAAAQPQGLTAVAGGLSSQGTEPLIEAVADGGAEGAADIDLRLFGGEAGNVGITQFQVRRSLVDPLGYEILVAVRNASSRPVQCRLELDLAGRPVDVLPLTLQADEKWSHTLEKTSVEGGHLLARLTSIEPVENARSRALSQSSNALAVDDNAWAILPRQEIQQVLIVSPGNLFLQKVFEANPLVRVQLRRDFPETWPKGGIIVLHGGVPQQLPGGNLFVVDPAGSCDLWELGQPLENPIVTDQDHESTLMTHVRLDNVVMPEARRVKFRADAETATLVESLSGDPIYAQASRDTGKCLVLTVNLDRSDLAFRTAFPIMVTNSLGWFTDSAGELRESLATGSTAAHSLGAGGTAAQLQLVGPSGVGLPLAAAAPRPVDASSGAAATGAAGVVSLGPFDRCGIWKLAAATNDDAPPTAEFAVNLASERETDLRPASNSDRDVRGERLAASWLARPLWYYLLAAACVFSVVEWYLYQRRVLT